MMYLINFYFLYLKIYIREAISLQTTRLEQYKAQKHLHVCQTRHTRVLENGKLQKENSCHIFASHDKFPPSQHFPLTSLSFRRRRLHDREKLSFHIDTRHCRSDNNRYTQQRIQLSSSCIISSYMDAMYIIRGMYHLQSGIDRKMWFEGKWMENVS